MTIIEKETLERRRMPGPAFTTNYDNKYKENTVFAEDKGRVKNDLNVNKVND